MAAYTALFLAAVCCVAAAAAQDEDYRGWRRGRTSWYGEPDWVEPFVATRGVADDVPDYPGSCGRCYEIKCVDGPVLGYEDNPVPLEEFYYYPKFADVLDELGRSFPGNPSEADNYYTVQCYNNDPIVVKIIDMCPCTYCPAGENGCRKQEFCCYKSSDGPKAGQHTLDISFWAFQKMAHPSYGVMMLDFRPVDCDTREPLSFIPGFISKKLYSEMVGPGWAWFASRSPNQNSNLNFYVKADQEGLGGSAAACAFIYGGMGMTFWARGAGVPYFEPFDSVQTISFWIKNKMDPGSSAPIRVIVSGDQSKPTNSPVRLPDEPEPTFCDSQVFMEGRTPEEVQGDFKKYVISISEFQCSSDKIKKLNKLDFLTLRDADFCIDELELL